MYENRNFVIFSVGEINKINFEEVLETSSDTLRFSIDGTKTFVKWDGQEVPPSVQTLTTAEEYLTYTEMIQVLSGPEWTPEVEEL